MEKRIIRKGTLIIISEGEYSDYCAYGLLRALEDIDYDALRKEYEDAWL